MVNRNCCEDQLENIVGMKVVGYLSNIRIILFSFWSLIIALCQYITLQQQQPQSEEDYTAAEQ